MRSQAPLLLFLLVLHFSQYFSMQCVPSTSVALTSSLTLVGRSRAGDGTTFVIPQLQWMFDCGALVDGGGLKQPRVIFITHTHSDHVLTLAQWAHSRAAQTQKPPLQIYVPVRARPLIQTYLEAYGKMITMDLGSDDITTSRGTSPPYQLLGVEPGQEISIRHAGRDLVIRVVECVHRIDCLGYSIFERHYTLKDQYKGLPGKEIGQLRKQGVEIQDSCLKPCVCYLGDTTAQVFVKHPEILQEQSIIVVECSFLDEKNQDNAVRHKHMHWFDLKPIVEAHPQTLFVLTHFSLRHSSVFLREFFNQESATHRNVHPMLVEKELQDEWTAHRKQEHTTVPPTCNCFRCQPATPVPS